MFNQLVLQINPIITAIASLLMGPLALSIHWQGPWVFLAATAVSAVGYSLLFPGGLALINGAIPTERRFRPSICSPICRLAQPPLSLALSPHTTRAWPLPQSARAFQRWYKVVAARPSAKA